jgi:predicted nucleic acid-binding protein
MEKPYVIDASVALSWVLRDETNAKADEIRKVIEAGVQAWIPCHWRLEIANALLMAERRQRITPEEASEALHLMDELPLEEDARTAEQASGETLRLAREHGLTIYDAAYLELSKRQGAVLATFDDALIRAAKREKVALQE